MTPTRQYLVAEYLQLHGDQTSEHLSKIFDRSANAIRVMLGQMLVRKLVKPMPTTPRTWQFVALPTLGRGKVDQPTANSNIGGLLRANAIAALPVVRL